MTDGRSPAGIKQILRAHPSCPLQDGRGCRLAGAGGQPRLPAQPLELLAGRIAQLSS
jgi:hypothetical protein